MAEKEPSFEENHKQIRDVKTGNVIAVPCEVNDAESIANKRKAQTQQVQQTGERIASALTRDKQDQEKALGVFNHLKDKLIEKAKTFNLELDESMVNSMNDVQKYSILLQGIERETNPESSKKRTVAGTVPLTREQMTGESGHQSEGYDSYEEMIQDVHRKAHSDDPVEAKEYASIEKEFWIRFTSSLKSNHPFPIDIEVNPTGTKLKDLINDSNQDLQKTKRRLLEKKEGR